MDRFRRNSKSSMKSQENLKMSTPLPQPTQPNEWPQHEDELFKQIQNHHKSKEIVTEPGEVLNKFIEGEVPEKVVDPAEEAYKPPGQPDKDSKIPTPTARSSEDNSTEPKEGGHIQGKPDTDESPSEGKPEDATYDGSQDKNKENGTGKKEEDADEPIGIVLNIISFCIAFALAVILVTYYLLKDLVPVKLSNFRQRWERFTATLIVTPTFINMLYDEVLEPLTKLVKQPELFRKNPITKPAMVITPEQGK